MNSSGKTSSNGSTNDSSTKSSYSTNGGYSSPKISRAAKKARDTTGYRCVKEGRMFILEIPYKFKVPPLLEFIRVSLPMSCIVADYAR
jgi:hypothetical protein